MSIVFVRITGPVSAASGCGESEKYYENPKKIVGAPISSDGLDSRISYYLHEVAKMERRVDAVVGHRLVLALPHEADDFARRKILKDFIHEEFDPYDLAWKAFAHRPTDSGQKNYHAHVIVSDRPLLSVAQRRGRRPLGLKNRRLFRIGWIHGARQRLRTLLVSNGFPIQERPAPIHHVGPIFRKGAPGYAERMRALNSSSRQDPLPGLDPQTAAAVLLQVPQSRRRRVRGMWLHRDSLPAEIHDIRRAAGLAATPEGTLVSIVMGAAGEVVAGKVREMLAAAEGVVAPQKASEALLESLEGMLERALNDVTSSAGGEERAGPKEVPRDGRNGQE